jgi:hypothetical protein
VERDWWLRAVLVLQRPGFVFAALRRDDDAESRQEPLLAIVLLGGIAGVLSTNLAGRVLDDFEIDAVVLAVWAFLAGGLYGIAGYYLLGALVLLGERLAGSTATYVRSRHVLGFACVPLALSLIVQPVKIAAYGEDAFRSGGSDTGIGADLFEGVELVVLAWCAGLLVTGLRTVNSWSWPRALAAAVPALLLPAVALGRAYGLL